MYWLLKIFFHSFLCFLFELCSGIQKQISTSSAFRKFLGLTLIRVSMAYMQMKRIYEVHEHNALFNICSYLIVCFKSFSAYPLFVVPEVLYRFWSALQGMCLTKEQKPPMYIVALVDWLWARVVAALLWPLHMLAKRLIYKKIHSSIGISKVDTNSVFYFVKLDIYLS